MKSRLKQICVMAGIMLAVIATAGTSLAGTKLRIDRSQPIDPVKLLRPGWTIAEQDERSLALKEVDLSQVRLVQTLNPGERCVQGEAKIQRLRSAGYILLDAKIFQTLWKNQRLIPKSWRQKTGRHATWIFFDGTVLASEKEDARCVLFLYWKGKRWYRGCFWLESGWEAHWPSAVLEQPRH